MKMPTESSSIFHTRLFTLRVGENAAALTVHSGAVAAVSSPLKQLMEEQTPDGLRTSAILPDVREEDLVRFCDFIYTNDYTSPYPVVIKPSLSTPGSPSPVVRRKSSSLSEQPPAKRIRSEGPAPEKTRPPLPPLKTYSSSTTMADVLGQNKAKLSSVFSRAYGSANGTAAGKINNANEDNSNVLIAHAAMNNFAFQYEVWTLQTLSFNKLKDKLLRMELFPNRVGNLTLLIRYIYGNELQDANGELRMLVARYAVSKLDVLGDNDDFVQLLADGGLFVQDFWALVFDNLLRA